VLPGLAGPGISLRTLNMIVYSFERHAARLENAASVEHCAYHVVTPSL
jgi:hypothetical protein